MARPSPALIEWIRAQVSDWGEDDAAIAATLNARTVENPVEAPVIPKPMDALAILPMLEPESLAKIEGVPGLLTTINTAIGLGHREEVQRWVLYCHFREHITEAERDALLAELAATVPDPAYQAELPGVVVEFGRRVDAADVAAAREAGDG